MITWCSWVASPTSGQRSLGTSEEMVRALGKVSRAIATMSLIKYPSWMVVRSLASPRLKLRICLTISAPRWALASMVVTASSNSSALSRCRSIGTHMTIGVRMLFRSWAMPLTKVPMLTMRWARNNWASSPFTSVRSVSIARIPLTLPGPSRSRLHRLRTVTNGRPCAASAVLRSTGLCRAGTAGRRAGSQDPDRPGP